MTIQESNKLIAEFMGWTEESPYSDVPDAAKRWFCPYEFPHYKKAMTTNGLEFHNSWDWLMPVIEKIERSYLCEQEYANQVVILLNTCSIEPSNYANPIGQKMIESFGETKLEATYKAVVEFIQWYNEKKS